MVVSVRVSHNISSDASSTPPVEDMCNEVHSSKLEPYSGSFAKQIWRIGRYVVLSMDRFGHSRTIYARAAAFQCLRMPEFNLPTSMLFQAC